MICLCTFFFFFFKFMCLHNLQNNFSSLMCLLVWGRDNLSHNWHHSNSQLLLLLLLLFILFSFSKAISFGHEPLAFDVQPHMIMMSVKSFSYSKPLALEEYSTHRIAFMVLFLFDSLIGVVTINYYMQENYSNSAFKFHRKKNNIHM